MVEVIRSKDDSEKGTGPAVEDKPGVQPEVADQLGGVGIARKVAPADPTPAKDRDLNAVYSMNHQAAEIADESILKLIDAIPTVKFEMPRILDVHLDRDSEGKKTGYSIVAQGFDDPFTLKKVGANPGRLLMVDGEPMATASRGYTPVQNRSVALKTYETLLLAQQPVRGLSRLQLGVQGSEVMSFEIGDHFDLEGAPERQISRFGADVFQKHASITNSYDMSMGLWALSHHIRIVCENTFYMAMHDEATQRSRASHRVLGQDQSLLLTRASDAIRRVREASEQLFGSIRLMREREISDPEIVHVIETGRIRKYEAERMEGYSGLELEFDPAVKVTDRGDIFSQWDMVNALTDVANHVNSDGRAFELQRGAIRRVLTAQRQAPIAA